MRHLRFALVLCSLFAFNGPACGQDEERIQKLFQDAIQAFGGETFLNVTDIVAEGNYFFFSRDGNSGLVKFDYYTKFPGKSRNELGNKKKLRDVTVFNLEKNEGWILQGQKETREATPEQMKEFRNAVKHNLHTIFRFRYKDPQNKLFYLGPGEGMDVQYETVKLLDTENDEVLIYFDRASKLPAKIEFRAVGKRGAQLREVREFSQWHVIQGVNTPMRVDTFINGQRASQQFIVKITYDSNLQDNFFGKPIPPK